MYKPLSDKVAEKMGNKMFSEATEALQSMINQYQFPYELHDQLRKTLEDIDWTEMAKKDDYERWEDYMDDIERVCYYENKHEEQ